MNNLATKNAPASVAGRGTFQSIQLLRGIAALLVVVFHTGLHFDTTEMTFRTGNAGVDIFFVISGFVMWTVTTRRPIGPSAFLNQRFVRLVPLYWGFTLLLFAIATLAPSVIPHMRGSAMHLVLSLAFVPHVSPDTGHIMPLLGQGWTLNFEVFFYLLFAAVLVLRPERRLAAITAVLIALPVLGLFILTPEFPITTLLSPLLIEFLGGIAIAWLVGAGIRPSASWSWWCVVLGAVLMARVEPAADAEWSRLVHFGIPAILLVGGLVGTEISGSLRVARLPLWLGDASYSIYLSHTFVISILGKIWPASLATWAFIIVATVCSVLAGGLVHTAIERPLLELMRGRYRLPRLLRQAKVTG